MIIHFFTYTKKYQEINYKMVDDNMVMITIPDPPELPTAEAAFPAPPPPPPELGMPLPAVVPDALSIVEVL